MEEVGIRQLKNRLSHYLRQVRAGHPIQIIDRGEVVAELWPPVSAIAGETPQRLAEMARRGLVKLGAPNNPSLYPTLPRVVPPGTAQRLLDEERGER